jgi:acyl carrier protein
MPSDIETTVIRLIANQKQIDTEQIKPELSLEALGVSSLDAITIVYEIEEVYDIEVPSEQLEELKTVQNIIDGVASLVDNQGEA